MNVREAIIQIRHIINDKDELELEEEELLMYLNKAIQYVASYLIQANSPYMVQDMTISTETAMLPDNFIKTAGNFPIKMTGNSLKWLDYEEGKTLKLRFFATCGLVELEDEMPFHHDALNQQTIQAASIYAMNQIEADISQDKALMDEVNAALTQVIGGVIAQ